MGVPRVEHRRQWSWARLRWVCRCGGDLPWHEQGPPWRRPDKLAQRPGPGAILARTCQIEQVRTFVRWDGDLR